MTATTPTSIFNRLENPEEAGTGEVMRGEVGALLVETAAAGHKNARRPPLQEKDDGDEHADFSEHWIKEDLLERLIGETDAERADDRARDVAHAADDHRHETIDDVA